MIVAEKVVAAFDVVLPLLGGTVTDGTTTRSGSQQGGGKAPLGREGAPVRAEPAARAQVVLAQVGRTSAASLLTTSTGLTTRHSISKCGRSRPTRSDCCAWPSTPWSGGGTTAGTYRRPPRSSRSTASRPPYSSRCTTRVRLLEKSAEVLKKQSFEVGLHGAQTSQKSPNR